MDGNHIFQWQCAVMVLLSLAQISIQYDNLLVPPKFPDLLSSFAESISASENLRQVIGAMKQDAELCGCSGVANVNWTDFNANIGSYLLPVDSDSCSSKTDLSTHHPNVAAVSSGEGDGSKGLVVGLSLAFVAVILVVVVLLTIKKYRSFHAAWDAVKKKSVGLQRQRSDCQPTLPMSSHRPVVSVSDSIAYSDTASVSKMGCFSFPSKVQTILLPLKTQKEVKDKSDLPPKYVFDYYTNLSKSANLGCTEKGLEMSDSAHSLSSSGAPQMSGGLETKADDSEKKENFHLKFIENGVPHDAPVNRKVSRASVDRPVCVDNVAWSVLPNNRQFLRERDELVDLNNYHLFSYGTPLPGKTSSTRL